MVAGVNSLSDLTIKQRETLRMQCLCLKQAHESAIQFMNHKKWHECCEHAVQEIATLGISTVKNEKTIPRLNIQFRNGERLTVSNARSQREPKLFTLFPEFQEKFVTHCNKQIKQGGSSTEECTTEVKTKTIPQCYEKPLKEAGDEGMTKMTCQLTMKF